MKLIDRFVGRELIVNVLFAIAMIRMRRAGVGPRPGDVAAAVVAAAFLTTLAAVITRV